MVNPRASPPSRVSVRRPSCSLISARGACALGIPLLRWGPRHPPSLASCLPALRRRDGKKREWAPTASDAAAGGMTSYGWRGRALGGPRHAAERPAPARELPGDRRWGTLHAQWLKGVGFVCALAFCAEVGDFSRFASGRRATSYFGPAPSERPGGGVRRCGGLTKGGCRNRREAARRVRPAPLRPGQPPVREARALRGLGGGRSPRGQGVAPAHRAQGLDAGARGVRRREAGTHGSRLRTAGEPEESRCGPHPQYPRT